MKAKALDKVQVLSLDVNDMNKGCWICASLEPIDLSGAEIDLGLRVPGDVFSILLAAAKAMVLAACS